jgi:selenide,water dikinase
VLTGVREGVVGPAEYDAATGSMAQLVQGAAEALRPFEPNAVTDVTGFGLFGHVFEVADRSGVRIVLEADRLPLLPGVAAVAERGLRTGGDGRNRDFAGAAVELDGVSESTALVGFDPQTSGGLLVSLPADRAAVLEATFSSAGLFLARIGRVEAGQGVLVT